MKRYFFFWGWGRSRSDYLTMKTILLPPRDETLLCCCCCCSAWRRSHSDYLRWKLWHVNFVFFSLTDQFSFSTKHEFSSQGRPSYNSGFESALQRLSFTDTSPVRLFRLAFDCRRPFQTYLCSSSSTNQPFSKPSGRHTFRKSKKKKMLKVMFLIIFVFSDRFIIPLNGKNRCPPWKMAPFHNKPVFFFFRWPLKTAKSSHNHVRCYQKRRFLPLSQMKGTQEKVESDWFWNLNDDVICGK